MAERPPITVATPPLPLAGRKVAGGVFDGNSWAKVLLPEKATFESAPHGLQMAGQQFGGAAAVAAVHDRSRSDWRDGHADLAPLGELAEKMPQTWALFSVMTPVGPL